MKATNFEKILMDPLELQKYADKAEIFKKKYGDHGGSLNVPTNKVIAVKEGFMDLPPSKKETRFNDFDNDVSTLIQSQILGYLPEVEEGPKPFLSRAVDFAKREKKETGKISSATHGLLENAVNQVTSVSAMDDESEELVKKAGEFLQSIWTRLYEHANFGGRSYFASLSSSWVYKRISHSSLGSANMNDKISSLYIDASASEVNGDIYLFQDSGFTGRFVRYVTTPGNPTTRNNIGYVGNYINDRTSSALIVRRYDGEIGPIALGDFGLRDEIANYVNSVSNISLRGTPIITWDMWPSGGGGHPNDARRFIYIRIPVRVDVPNWWDYDAEVRYWVYPYVTTGGEFRASVSYFGCWVESGVKSGSIADRIMQELPNTVGAIDSRLRDALSIARIYEPYIRQILLPGRANNVGHTDDDVSIVLVRRST